MNREPNVRSETSVGYLASISLTEALSSGVVLRNAGYSGILSSVVVSLLGAQSRARP